MLNSFKKFEFFIHETKRNVFLRFSFILLIVLVYFLFMISHYGIANGFSVTILTWSFFVLCTPIADAGFLLDFPIRFITGTKMIISEIFVWVISVALASYFFIYSPETFSYTVLLKIFEKILANPFPYWIIIIISMVGTFLSIYFGDELFDTIKHIHRIKHKKHKNKYRLILLLFFIILIVVIYNFLLKDFNIKF